MVASFLLAYILSRGLQKQISQPILALADTAKAIANRQDYSVRAPRIGEGEFVLLTDAFNLMLARIHDGIRALSESEERFRSAMQYSAIGMALVSPDGGWMNVNQALCRIVGYTPEEMLTQNFQAVLHPDDVEVNQAHLRRMLDCEIESYRLEGRYLHRDGHQVCVDLNVSLVCDESGLPLYFIAQVQDITERKDAEEMLRRLNSDLEQRVQERTRKLNEANKELESFSYSVSHDLRAPLRAMDGFSRILIEDYGNLLDEEGLRILDVIRGNTQKMGQLIDDILAFSRLGRKQVERSIIDVNELARDASVELGCGSTDSSLQFKIGSLPEASGDKALMRQVLRNLLSNAAKYSRTKEAPIVEVGSYTENGDNVYYVRDNGVGFDMAYSNKLFGVFQRLHGPDEFEGTGVGLAIVQRIIQRHGGRVWAEAELNKGATFYFTLPKEIQNEGRSATNE
jgi:PAS domain S-box-containing protein